MGEEIDRKDFRNIHVYSPFNDWQEIAGFYQHGGVSISTFVSWIRQVCIIEGEWGLYPYLSENNHVSEGTALDLTSQDEIQPGQYVIRSLPPGSAPVSVSLLQDVSRPWAHSVKKSNSPHITEFRKRVTKRDQRCCFVGHIVWAGDTTGFEVTHIFPLNETATWDALNYKRFITDDLIAPGQEMNSLQQGFLCSATEHERFKDYAIGVNPDMDYKIFDFVGRDSDHTPHGRTFYRDPNVEEKYLPSADLLRDHFHQCLLRHVKGRGERNGNTWENNDLKRLFDPDGDLRQPGGFNLEAGSWWSGSAGKQQLEAELAGRLWGAAAGK